MLTQKETPAIHADAVSILHEFNNPAEPFNAGMVKDLIIDVLIDHCSNEEGSILTERDQFVLWKLKSIIIRIEQWQKTYTDKGKVLDQLYKHGLSLTMVDQAMNAVYNKIERGKFDEKHKETLRKLWCIISEKPELVNL